MSDTRMSEMVDLVRQTITSAGCYDYPLTGGYISPPFYYYHVSTPPTECSGDVHVFPCPHCEKCKCGKASVKCEAKRGSTK